MNREFKLRFDQMREGNPSKAEEEGADENLLLPSAPARSLCLVWPNGRRFFLSYAYLMAGELNLSREKNEIMLYFSSHTVTLRGYGLESLFTELMQHLPSLIYQSEERYVTKNATASNEIAVIEMQVEENKH
ncbi:hypothetical protein [Runella zeae]|uniref:hypothetical protein n=1 Tax=Runella zeae TaxID=94255 RepID=UPI002355DF5C|nr:hypothetical protein [Runella zeae]